jgi:S-adenosylmethionine:tRNA ribosyltransferase-isomerase
MNTSELDYALPEALIAQHPCSPRDSARMLVLDRATQTFKTDVFRHVAKYLRAGDCMAINNTRVIRARLFGHKPSGGRVEIFLLREEQPGVWVALVRPSSRVKPGTPILLPGGINAHVEDILPDGRRRVRFERPDMIEALERIGEIPLPPYIQRESREAADARRYQTIYAEKPGAVAAPTAGLHFTDRVFHSLDAAGVRRAQVTLHVGYGTFKPITSDTLEAHQVEPEEFELSKETARALNETRKAGGRIAAVGTTVTRVLETRYRTGKFRAGGGVTGKYIYPPYRFQAVDILQTNFHLPRSSLLALVCAFAGTEFILEAYHFAVKEQFRFYSYGDVMLIL